MSLRFVMENNIKFGNNIAGSPRSTSYNSLPYGGYAVSGAVGSVGGGGSTSNQGGYPGQGSSSRQTPQHQRGRGRGFTPSSSPGYSSAAVMRNLGRGSSAGTRRGGVNMRGRGRGQRGRGRGNMFSGGHSDNYSDYGNEPQHSYSDNTGSMGQAARQFGGAAGHGRGAFSPGYSTGARRDHQPSRPWSGPSHTAGINQPPVSPLTLSANPPHLPFQLTPGQSPGPLFGAPPMAPPPPPSAPPITSPLHLVPHSPLQRFPSYPPGQSSPTSPWAPPTQPLPPQQQHPGHDGERYGSHHLHQPPYQPRQPMQYGHQQQQYHGGSGSGEDFSAAGLSAGQAQSSGTQGQASDVIKALVSYIKLMFSYMYP